MRCHDPGHERDREVDRKNEAEDQPAAVELDPVRIERVRNDRDTPRDQEALARDLSIVSPDLDRGHGRGLPVQPLHWNAPASREEAHSACVLKIDPYVRTTDTCCVPVIASAT